MLIITLDNMFIPIASPVVAVNRMYKYWPDMRTSNFVSLAYLLVESKADLIILNFSGTSIHNFALLYYCSQMLFIFMLFLTIIIIFKIIKKTGPRTGHLQIVNRKGNSIELLTFSVP